jgi:hypothetical protein
MTSLINGVNLTGAQVGATVEIEFEFAKDRAGNPAYISTYQDLGYLKTYLRPLVVRSSETKK